ncbi:MAG: pantetheine-phosphate adenylyltransferase [candidate division Zixibacteria bacterium]|nr:pantetheine-phosphate adenylyltransferase [candidate division Zixibacteria bacterium]MCI0596411.1 pantetheine-phosphate adenylyltransferase [candidate division Zixibacteria bacterium]
MKKALYPGTFDPITNGHLDLIERALALFDGLIVAAAENPQKMPLFSLAERTELLNKVLPASRKVEIISFGGLTAALAREKGVTAIVRGLRAVSDFEYEFQIALMNRRLAPKVETVFLMPSEKYTYLSSTVIKNVFSHGGDVSGLVPEAVLEALKTKFGNK